MKCLNICSVLLKKQMLYIHSILQQDICDRIKGMSLMSLMFILSNRVKREKRNKFCCLKLFKKLNNCPYLCNQKSNCRCCYFQMPSVVHCMNATASAQSTNFLQNFYPQTNFAQLLRVARKHSCTFGMINRGRLELATSPIGMGLGPQVAFLMHK